MKAAVIKHTVARLDVYGHTRLNGYAHTRLPVDTLHVSTCMHTRLNGALSTSVSRRRNAESEERTRKRMPPSRSLFCSLFSSLKPKGNPNTKSAPMMSQEQPQNQTIHGWTCMGCHTKGDSMSYEKRNAMPRSSRHLGGSSMDVEAIPLARATERALDASASEAGAQAQVRKTNWIVNHIRHTMWLPSDVNPAFTDWEPLPLPPAPRADRAYSRDFNQGAS